MNAAKFEARAARIAGELEGKLAKLNDEDRETLGALLGSAARVFKFLGAVKSDALKDAGKSVEQFFMLVISLQAPVIGMGDKAGETLDAALPAMERAAPTVAAVLRSVLGA